MTDDHHGSATDGTSRGSAVSESLEWRLKRIAAQAALRVAEAGALDEALVTLAECAAGRDRNGKALDVSRSERRRASSNLLRAIADIVPKDVLEQATTPPETPTAGGGQHVHLHLHERAPTDPDAKLRWLAQLASASRELVAQTKNRATVAPAGHDAAVEPGGSNGHEAEDEEGVDEDP